MKNADLITPKQAVEFAMENYTISVSKQTILNWLKTHEGLGHKVAGRWYVEKTKLIELFEGKTWKNTKEEKQ